MEGFLEAVAPEWSLRLELGKGSRSVCVCVGVGGGGQPFLGKDIDRPGERPFNSSLRCVRGGNWPFPYCKAAEEFKH